MTKMRHRREKLGRQTLTGTSGPRTAEREPMTTWTGTPTWMPVSEREKVVAMWSLEMCEAVVVQIKRARGNNQRAWPVVTQETYEVLMRRIRLLKRMKVLVVNYGRGGDPREEPGVVSAGGM